ncbi:gamma subclass chorismate mutase AroQ [Halomonas binhaiensis]|nr:gamma subclass chorismate mutase AroQ [Halomonas binhaiensis]
MKKPRGALFSCAMLVALLFNISQANAETPSEDAKQTVNQLLTLIDERLAIAPEVAKAKWNSGAPINAPEREAQILERVVAEAASAGVDEALAQTFFQHQFDASKRVQQRLHDQWQKTQHPPFDNAPDLANDIRPKLDKLTPQLIGALHDFQETAKTPGVGAYLESQSALLVQDDASGDAREEAVSPLFDVATP